MAKGCDEKVRVDLKNWEMRC